MALSTKKWERLTPGPARRISGGLGPHTHPAWSPDGRWLAFTTSGGPDTHICVTDPEGRVARVLTEGQGWHVEPAWAPDGQTIAYSWKKTEAGRWQIWVSDLFDPSRTRCLLSSTRFNYEHPTFAPDGKSLLFSSTQGASDDAYNLWRLELDSGEKIPVSLDPSRHDAHPAVSPDGLAVLFEAMDGGAGRTQLHMMALADGATRRLTDHKRSSWGAFFVDEHLALFTRAHKRRGQDLYALHLETGQTRRLIEGARQASATVDEQGNITLAWACVDPETGHDEIFIAALEGYRASRESRGHETLDTPLTPDVIHF